MRSPDIQLCPFPDCESYAKKIDNNKYVNCIQNGHKFCFNCLKEWHGNEPCKDEIDKSFQNWKDSKQEVKRCPKCKYFIEKYEGCNHITCFNCKYQWCWLCNQKYEDGHYKMGGSCFGLQYSKNSCFSNKLCLFFYKLLMILLKSIGFAILAPIVLFLIIFTQISKYRHYCKSAQYISYLSIILLSLSTFYSFLIIISSILSILMIFIWPLNNIIFRILEHF